MVDTTTVPTTKSLSQRSFGAIAGVLLSRASGVIRTIVINAVLGANTTLDAFNTAFRFPNSLRDLFADGALSAAFMKALVDARAQSFEAEKQLTATVLGFFITVTCILALIAAWFAPQFIALMSNTRFAHSGGMLLATTLFQVLIFYLPLTMLNAIMMALLGVRGHTFRAMNSSIFLSVGMVAGVLSTPFFPTIPAVWGLTWGAIAGVLMQLIYQSLPLWCEGILGWPNFNPIHWLRDKTLHAILWMMAPRAIGQGATTLALMINTFFALQISAGSMTYIATTVIIIQVPIGLFGVATGFAALPVLTEALQRGEVARFSQLLTQSLDTSCWLAFFTSLGFAWLMVPLYIVIFQHGAITFHDTLANCVAISAYAAGVFFGAGSKVLLNTLYAINATRLIVLYSVVYLILSTVLSALLTPRFGLLGLGLAFSLSSGGNFWLNYFFIWREFKKRYTISPYSAATHGYTGSYLLASFLVMCASISGYFLIQYGWSHWLWINNFIHALISLGVLGVMACGIFLLLTWKIGPPVLQRFLMRYGKK